MGALIDANLLCLLVVGIADRRSISVHPRLKTFDDEDFQTVAAILDRVGAPILCPQVLTETSNLLRYRQSPEQTRTWRTTLFGLIEQQDERRPPAITIAGHPDSARLGFTNAALLILAEDRRLTLLSDDFPPCLAAERQGLRTVKRNYVRDGALGVSDISPT